MSVLDFAALRRANTMRLPQFKNPKGEPAHTEPDGSDWALSAWMNATAGEAGELAEALLFMAMSRALGSAGNTIKKIERGDHTLDEMRAALASEFADVVTYLDILAMRAGIDLGEAVVAKFNEVSRRVGADVFIAVLEAAPDYYEHREALSDLVHLMSEEDALNGGGPGFSGRWEKAKRRALELFEP